MPKPVPLFQHRPLLCFESYTIGELRFLHPEDSFYTLAEFDALVYCKVVRGLVPPHVAKRARENEMDKVAKRVKQDQVNEIEDDTPYSMEF